MDLLDDKAIKQRRTNKTPTSRYTIVIQIIVPTSSLSTMSNADKFLSAAESFPDDALPEHRVYEHPLVQRYATKEMSFIWSPAMKFTTWRKLWTALATAEKELGLEITDEQLEEMRTHLYDVNFQLAAEKEAEFRHDVMGHVHAFETNSGE